MTTRGRGRPRIFDEDAYLERASESDVLDLLSRAHLAGIGGGTAGGLVVWLLAKKAGGDLDLSHDTHARYRKILAEIVPEISGPTPARAKRRGARGAAVLALVVGTSGASTLIDARSARPALAESSREAPERPGDGRNGSTAPDTADNPRSRKRRRFCGPRPVGLAVAA